MTYLSCFSDFYAIFCLDFHQNWQFDLPYNICLDISISRSEWLLGHASVIFLQYFASQDWMSIKLDKLINDMLYVWLIEYIGHADLFVMLQWFYPIICIWMVGFQSELICLIVTYMLNSLLQKFTVLLGFRGKGETLCSVGPLFNIQQFKNLQALQCPAQSTLQ